MIGAAAVLPLSFLLSYLLRERLASGGHKSGAWLEVGLTMAIIAWIVGGFALYSISLYLEYQRPCENQRTNQLPYECRKYFRLEE